MGEAAATLNSFIGTLVVENVEYSGRLGLLCPWRAWVKAFVFRVSVPSKMEGSCIRVWVVTYGRGNGIK